MISEQPIRIATRGSALALAQANWVLEECRRQFPERIFEIKVFKTTGDKLQTMNLAGPSQEITKGLFTKELETALLQREADLAVHSLKDLPTDLPPGLKLSGVSQREDPRDIFIFRHSAEAAVQGSRVFPSGTTLRDLPPGAVIATSSTRRQAQVLAARPDLKTVPIRGNVGTRIRKLLDQPELDAIILAMAGLRRLGVTFGPGGALAGEGIPAGCAGVPLDVDEMIPCVGQAALGFESRENDPETDAICARLNDPETLACVTAERAFLAAMGGGCLSPVAAYAALEDGRLRLRAISFRNETMRRAELTAPRTEAAALGREAARQLA